MATVTPSRRARLRLGGRDEVDGRVLAGAVVAAVALGAVMVAHWAGAIDAGTPFAPLQRAVNPLVAAVVLAAAGGGVAALVAWARHLPTGRGQLLLVGIAVGQLWLTAAAHAGVALAVALVDARDLGVLDVGDAVMVGLRADLAWVVSWGGMAAAIGIATLSRQTLQDRPGRAVGLALLPQVALVVVVGLLGIDLEITDAATGVPAGTTMVLRDLPLSQLSNALVGLALPVSLLFMFGALETSRFARDVGATTARFHLSWWAVLWVIVAKVALLATGFWLLEDTQAFARARVAEPWSWAVAVAFVGATAWWLVSRRRLPPGMEQSATVAGLAVIGGWLAPVVVISALLVLTQLVPVVFDSSRGGVAAAAATVGLVVAGNLAGRGWPRRTASITVAVAAAAALAWSTGARDDVVGSSARWRATVSGRVSSMADTVSDHLVLMQALVLLASAGAAAVLWRRHRGVAIALAIFWVWNLTRMVDVLCLEVGWCGFELNGLLVRSVQLDAVVTVAAIALLVAGLRGRAPIGPAAATGALVTVTVVLHAGSLVMQATAAPLFYAGMLLPGAYLLLVDAGQLNPPNDGATPRALSSLGTLVLALALVTLQLLSGQMNAGEDTSGDVAAVLLLVPLMVALLGAGLRGQAGDLWHDALQSDRQADPPS